jgi:methylenetetrahydrofolate dehydrogenase (NADP+) / methenyltetrahydrofolate cyclohydrolase
MIIIDGKQRASILRNSLKESITRQNLENKISLGVLMIGDNPASEKYVSNKVKACNEVGIKSKIINLNESISYDEALSSMKSLQESCDGIIIQLPIPDIYKELIKHIDPTKDSDGLGNISISKLYSNEYGIRPCTPQGCIDLLESTIGNLSGKNILIIGRSLIVGRPMAMMCMHKNMTVTIAHSYTKDIEKLIYSHDIIVSAVGSPGWIKRKWLNNDAIFIDVGISIIDGKMYGDLDQSVNHIFAKTTVPGGVGPMTVYFLLYNTYRCFIQRKNKQ